MDTYEKHVTKLKPKDEDRKEFVSKPLICKWMAPTHTTQKPA